MAQAGVYEDFFIAIRRDSTSQVLSLLLKGFDPNTVDPKGRSGLMIAIQEGSPKVGDLLVSLDQVDVNTVSPAGESALMLASLKGQEDMVRKLIGRGADVNKTGWTPLHYAASGGHVGILRLLFEHHAFVDPESPNGTTPLMMAAQYGNAATVKLLLDEGAVPNAKNRLGLSALDFARMGNRPDATAILAPLVAPPKAQPLPPLLPPARTDSSGSRVAPAAMPVYPPRPAAPAQPSGGRW
ncbi:MAG: ankyrin repeat domain-containing protein [Betaproteobacteria bacterium]